MTEIQGIQICTFCGESVATVHGVVVRREATLPDYPDYGISLIVESSKAVATLPQTRCKNSPDGKHQATDLVT